MATQRTSNNIIVNNYINRASCFVYSGAGINTGYVQDTKISHNEISYNYIKDANRILPDGGGIYTLADLKSTKIEGNYIVNNEGSGGGLYTDNGTWNSHWVNNVVENCTLTYHVWLDTVKDNRFSTVYTTNSLNMNNGHSSNRMDPLNIYTIGNEPPEVFSITDNAAFRGNIP